MQPESFNYDLSRDIASYDFHSWMVMSAADGAKEIVFQIDKGFKTTKWPAEITRRRFETMLWPSPSFLGLARRIGTDGKRTEHQPHLRDLVKFSRAGRSFPRLRSTLPPGKARYTVTLRQDKRLPHRNSNEPAWRQFAAEIGARVIEDYDVEVIDQHECMALYAGAEMNFGINNGPFWMVALSEYPMMLFDVCNPAGSLSGMLPVHGIPAGTQMPWSRPNQKMIWEPDDLPTLRKHFALWKGRGAS